jgi:hypothetical protein
MARTRRIEVWQDKTDRKWYFQLLSTRGDVKETSHPDSGRSERNKLVAKLQRDFPGVAIEFGRRAHPEEREHWRAQRHNKAS